MTHSHAPDQPDTLSREELADWLAQELSDSAKAFQLRSQEATSFVTDRLLGRITAQEALERHWRYHHRWGEALPGTHAVRASTDEEVLASIDKVRGPCSSPNEIMEKYARQTRARVDTRRSR